MSDIIIIQQKNYNEIEIDNRESERLYIKQGPDYILIERENLQELINQLKTCL